MSSDVKVEQEINFPERETQFSKHLKHTVEMISIKPATYQT